MYLFRILTFTAFLYIPYFLYSQERQNSEFGEPTESDFAMQVYEKDTTAEAVVLFEQGYYEFETVGDYIRLIKNVYRKVKVFDSKRYDGGTVNIPLLVSNGMGEKVTRYNALTHNGPIKTYVASDAIFVTSVPRIGKVCRIVFPNVKDGSIIEYSYRLESPFFFNFNGWKFQGELPKLYTEFISRIAGNYRYKSVMYGTHPLHFQSSELEKGCFRPAKHYSAADCVTSVYAMTDVPAFHKEDYMLSASNYTTRIDFEPIEFVDHWGGTNKFSNNWKDVDKLFKKGDYVGKQLNKSGYFKRYLPDSILSKSNDLERAKAVYTFIQNHYTWDGSYYNSETRVKDAFDQKKGSVPAINLALINGLRAASLDAKLMLLSTRQNGLPTEPYPVMTKFNYTIAVLKIGDNTYLLDATDKQAPFGIIPFQALNVLGRVMDFKKGSYWMPIAPFKQNIDYVNAQIAVETNGDFVGEVNRANYGYIALGKRNNIADKNIGKYIKTAQNEKAGVEIEDYKVEDLHLIEKPLKESYHIEIEPETVSDKVLLYPFFTKTYISENPFKMKERSYPMDFGFPFTHTYLIAIDLGNAYEIEQLPKSRSIKLPGDDAECSVTYMAEGNKINVRFNMKLSTYRFQPYAYKPLKEFFGMMVTMLKEEAIILKKI